MEVLKKKMAQLRAERDGALERADGAEQKAKEAKDRFETVSINGLSSARLGSVCNSAL